MSKKLSNENVLDDVSKDFEKLVESILKNGLDEATKIISDSETQSKNQEQEIESQQSKEFDIKSGQIIGAAEMESRNSNLLLLEKNINKVFTAALKGLSSDKGKNYPKSLELFINEGLNTIDDSDVVVSCNKKDSSIVKDIIGQISSKSKKSITLSDTYITTSGGVIVSNADSTVIVNNTIEDRLERMKAELRTDVAKKFK
ncbi:MAG: V-type ATP synthase subunit E family protein [Nitrososphaerales archaeon]|nr:V-type ATP synthase subunit E family protein [Nitrososphaerales archaeon]|tara:strand:+ start:2010 stop:2612 length:603 start_codon:yes stop_codon:yes gene_type:complete